MESFFKTIVNGFQCAKCGMILNNTSIFHHERELQCDKYKARNMNEVAIIIQRFKQVIPMSIERLSMAIESVTISRSIAAQKQKERLKQLQESKKREQEQQKKRLRQLLRERVRERQREKANQKERERKDRQQLERKEQCAVCHEDLDQNIDSPCKHGHFFHFQCIQSLKTHNQKQCPVCRSSIAKFMETFVLKAQVQKE